MGNRAYGLIEPVDSAFDWIKWFEPSLLAAALGGDGGAASAAVRGRRGGDSVACCHADDTLGRTGEGTTRGAWRQLMEWRIEPVGASYAEPSGGPGRRRWGGIGGGEGAARR